MAVKWSMSLSAHRPVHTSVVHREQKSYCRSLLLPTPALVSRRTQHAPRSRSRPSVMAPDIVPTSPQGVALQASHACIYSPSQPELMPCSFRPRSRTSSQISAGALKTTRSWRKHTPWSGTILRATEQLTFTVIASQRVLPRHAREPQKSRSVSSFFSLFGRLACLLNCARPPRLCRPDLERTVRPDRDRL